MNFQRTTTPQRARQSAPTFAEASRFWLKFGFISFGGPTAQIALLHGELVEKKKWISESRFLHALNFCMLLPGPEAHELAIYIGWLLHRIRGGLVAGTLFVLPGLFALTALSLIYAEYGHVGSVHALFLGLKAAVLAVVVDAVIRVGKRALKQRWLVAVAALAFLAIFAFALPFPLIVLAAALIGFVAKRAGLPMPGAGHGTT